MKNIYLINPEIKWLAFKKLWDASNANESGPIGAEMLKGKIIWEMLRDKLIMLSIQDNEIYFITEKPKIPKGAKLMVIK